MEDERSPRKRFLMGYSIIQGKVILLGPVVAQRVGRSISLLFHDRGIRKG
jgi:hypothetical protein